MHSSPAEAAPLRVAFTAQIVGIVAVWLLVFLLGRVTSADFSQIPLLLALLQGGIAAMVSLKLGAPPWWGPIHLIFLPLAVLMLRLEIAPAWFLAGFVLLFLIFWRTDRSRVPLYLSNRPTAATLETLLPSTSGRILDIGCGDGGLLRRIAVARPDCEFVGIEYAPLPWLLAKLRLSGIQNATVHWGDFWSEPLEGYDLVYAFLSPAPMSRLWAKACSEMRRGSMLVSNSFAVPGITPYRLLSVDDRRKTRLYLYRPDKASDSAAIPVTPARTDQE